MMTTTYNPEKLSVTVGGHFITGFSEDMVEFEKDEENWTTKVGAQGDAVRSKVNNTLATLKITLQSTSPMVAYLDGLARDQNLVNIAVIYNGTPKETINSTSAFIKKPAARTYGNEVADREFEFQLLDAVIS